MAYSVKEVRSKITEMLVKDDKVTLEQIHKKIADAAKLKVEEVKSIVAGTVTGTDDTMKSIYEILELKEDVVTTPPAATPPVEPKPVDIVEEAFKGVYGATSDNPVAKKISEVKGLLEKDGVSPETRKYLSEMVKSVIELIPIIADAKSSITYEQKSKDMAKELGEVKNSIKTLETDIKVAKGLTETIKSLVKTGGKSLNEQTNEGTGKKLEELDIPTQNELFAAALQKKTLGELMEAAQAGGMK